MTQHRDARGRIDITHIKDWDEASETGQIQLMERFRSVSARVQVPKPIDVGQLFAKLNSIDATRDPFSGETPPPSSSSPSHQPARSPTRSPEPDASKAHQIRCYRELVDDGGRPPMALELLDEIYLHHAQFVEQLGPWLAGGPVSSADDLGVFSRPLARWRQFRRWQRDNRGGGAPEDTLSAFRQRKQREYVSRGLGQLAADPGFDETTRKMWAHEQQEHSTIKESAVDFEGYVAAARRRLRDHGFTEEFRLDEDPRRQDKRLTWIEYLEFEYWWLDKRAKSVEAAQERHERAWKEVVGSGIPRPGETREHFLASHAQPTADSNSPHTSHPAREGASRGKLIDRLKRTARAYEDAKAAEARQLGLVQWALAQMPEKPKPPSAGPTKKGNKRRRQEDDDDAVDRHTKQPTTKRRRQGDTREEGGASRQRAVPRSRLTLGLVRPVQEPRLTNEQGHRRSARIRDLAARPP
ncbi:hypothetical protein QBC40DRAFT_9943 [Triangularia verruculosa]|uniref:Uncharacterized protein n=1 Tax=Triangularia verruculosa TaxID=2587418 RepID=A0AAN6XB88_9PEZI|nr:hypothetical protein QBC40DRAFT_9943 [Triangularia verruculosa]